MSINKSLGSGQFESIDTVISLDSGQFKNFLSAQFSTLQSTVFLEHEREVKSLQTEIQLLRERLSCLENGYAAENDNVRSSQDTNKGELFLPQIKSPQLQKASATEEAQLETDARIKPQPRSQSPDVVDRADVDIELQDDIPPNAEAIVPTVDEDRPRASKVNRRGSMKAETDVTEEETRLQRLVDNKEFESLSGFIIMINTVVMGLQLQYDGIDLGFEIEFPNFHRDAAGTWPHADTVFIWFDVGFTSVFLIELMLRLGAYGMKRSLRSGWMWFDTVVVAVSAIDTFGRGLLPFDPGMLRVLRLIRLVRLFKVLKTIQAFDSLFLLLKAIVASVHAALWSLVVLFCIQLVVGLFLSQSLQSYFADDNVTKKDRRLVFNYFGTFSKAMLTMFEITMANWVPSCRALVDNVNEFFMLFFIVYRCFFCFAVLKVIAAVFITETNRVLQHDDELTLMKLHREQIMFDKKVRKITNTFEESSFGWNELVELAYDREVDTHLKTLGFHAQDLEKLFWLIDDGDGRVSVDDFLSKVRTLKGEAKSIDLQTVLKIAHKIDREVNEVFRSQGYLQNEPDEDQIEDQICEAHRAHHDHR